jgi:tetratricopeptide (TPR) repeat protein
MTRSILVFITLLTLNIIATAQPDTLWQKANEAYSVGDYATAITLYVGLLDAGYEDANLYFNLGNAYFETDDLGRALLNYRRAQQFIPRDFELSRNLALVRALRVDVQGDESSLIDATALVTESVFTVDELSLIVFLLWGVWFALLCVWIVRPVWRRQLWLSLLIAGVMMASGLVLLIGRVYVEIQRPPAVVTAFQVEVMSGPGAEYIPLFTLYSAAEGRVLEQRDGWLRLLLSDRRQGWLFEEDVEIVNSGLLESDQ